MLVATSRASGLVRAGMSAGNSSKLPSRTLRPPRDFFLCGPPPFMEAGRAILMGLGVKPERIMQESFGGFASEERSTGFVGGSKRAWWSSSLDRARRTRPQRPDLTGGGRGAWSRHTFILPAGTVRDLQNEAAGGKCANGRGRGTRSRFESGGICADVRGSRGRRREA